LAEASDKIVDAENAEERHREVAEEIGTRGRYSVTIAVAHADGAHRRESSNVPFQSNPFLVFLRVLSICFFSMLFLCVLRVNAPNASPRLASL